MLGILSAESQVPDHDQQEDNSERTSNLVAGNNTRCCVAALEAGSSVGAA